MAAKSAKKGRITARALDPAMNRADAERLLAEIGALQRSEARIIAEADDRIGAIQADMGARLEPVRVEIEEKAATLQLWAEANRADLCPKGVKTVRFATGEISWRVDPPSVPTPRNLTDVISTLQRLGLDRLLRTKVELDKDAILSDPSQIEGIAGLSIKQAERLILKPAQTEIDPVELARKVR